MAGRKNKSKKVGQANKTRKKTKSIPEERRAKKLKADHIRSARSIFRNTGFERIPEIAEKNIDFLAQKGEFDDCFIYENLIVFVEYTTTSGSAGISDHLKHKKIIFDKIAHNQKDFISYLVGKFPVFATRLEVYHRDRYKLRIVYCSRFDFDDAVKVVVESPSYLDYPILKYFEKLASAVKLSALPEFLDFIDVDLAEVGENGIIRKQAALVHYNGSILPEEASGFPAGYKVVSFYADADALLQRAFVLRRKGWRASQQAYQRMIIPTKIEAIREGLRTKGQVAVNNIIATLPNDVLPVKADGHTISMSELTRTEPVTITLPVRPNSVGLIDGQHRLYSYYRAKDDDAAIAKLRHQQNLLVTGIIYPKGLDENEAERFEAGLFLTINSNQSSAPPDLRQEIEVLLNPFSHIAISKQAMERLSASGPLSGYVERFFYDKNKLKTSSIVNFGLVPLLKLRGGDSLFAIFNHSDKEHIADSYVILSEYIHFSVSQINIFLSAVRANVSADRWTTDPTIPKRLLTVTFINSFLITMRMLIQAGHAFQFDNLKAALSGFEHFDTKPFSSSQYNKNGRTDCKQVF